MNKEIIVDFSLKDGSCNIEANGFKGKECKKATEELERALGNPVDRKIKSEFYERTKEKRNRNRLRG